MRSLNLFLLVFAFALGSYAGERLDCRFEALFLKGDMQTWARVVDSLQRQALSDREHFSLALAEYGLIGYYLAQDRDDAAEVLYKKHRRHLDLMLEKYPKHATYRALDAATVGFQIALSPWRAPLLSSGHHEKLTLAMDLSDNDYMPLIEMGNSLFWRPSFVGGDKEKARDYYQKAYAILEQQDGCNWVFFHLGAWLGQVHARMDDPEKALLLYEELLVRAPGFQFVKDELLPQLKKGQLLRVNKEFE
jgi:tetratricopeptide (TPR) repeat protein